MSVEAMYVRLLRLREICAGIGGAEDGVFQRAAAAGLERTARPVLNEPSGAVGGSPRRADPQTLDESEVRPMQSLHPVSRSSSHFRWTRTVFASVCERQVRAAYVSPDSPWICLPQWLQFLCRSRRPPPGLVALLLRIPRIGWSRWRIGPRMQDAAWGLLFHIGR